MTPNSVNFLFLCWLNFLFLCWFFYHAVQFWQQCSSFRLTSSVTSLDVTQKGSVTPAGDALMRTDLMELPVSEPSLSLQQSRYSCPCNPPSSGKWFASRVGSHDLSLVLLHYAASQQPTSHLATAPQIQLGHAAPSSPQLGHVVPQLGRAAPQRAHAILVLRDRWLPIQNNSSVHSMTQPRSACD